MTGPAEYRRQGAGEIGILFVHGILGTPDRFLPLIRQVPESWSVRSLLLPGHGGTVLDMAGSSMDSWRRYVHSAVLDMRRESRRVAIAGHSMGTLFAMDEALTGSVEALFLLNVPLRARVSPRLLGVMRKLYTGSITEDDAWTRAAFDDYGVAPDKNLLHYLGWAPRYMELFDLMRDMRSRVPGLITPTSAFFSRRDEMVSPRSAEIMSQAPGASVTWLPASGHYYYSPEDTETVNAAFRDMLRRMGGTI